MGPVQVLVVGFDRPTFSGEVLAELTRLREAGIVRLVDVLLVSRADDGTLHTLDPPPGTASDAGELATAFFGRPGAEAVADRSGDASPDAAAWSLADAVPPGTTAAVALIEHVWAAPLRAAIDRAGGRPLEETWLGADDRGALEVLMSRRTT